MANQQVLASKDYVQDEINKATRNFGPLNLFPKEFTVDDWTNDGSVYKITVPKTEHQILSPIDVSVYILENSVYTKSHGIYDNTDYIIQINSNDDVTITTSESFSGRLIIY